MSADSSFIFNIGNLSAGQTGRISIVDSVACISNPNGEEKGCFSARIEPVQLCGAVTPSSINWDGAWLDAKATTLSNGGPVRIVVYSKGASMQDSTKWRVALGSTVLKEGKIKLQSGDSLVFVTPPANQNQLYLSIDQTLNCPAGKTSSLGHTGNKDATSFLAFEDGWLQFQSPYICDVFRYSYDPNEKTVEPSADIDPGNQLTYTIHFENYGNDTAFAVAISDTLSNGLDLKTFKLLGSSHSCTPFVDQNGSQPILNFLFNPIKLAAKKQDSILSKGYVRFSISSKEALQPGDMIKNTAHIYFDRNPAIVTNTAVSRIYTPQTISANSQSVSGTSKLILYPNPAQKTVWISFSDQQKAEDVSVFDSRGALVIKAKLTDGNLNIHSLRPGVYIVKAGNAQPARLVVTP